MEAPFYSLSFLDLSVPWEVAEDGCRLCSSEKTSFTSIQWLVHKSGCGTLPTKMLTYVYLSRDLRSK
jgi:hypothetical protein